jgi:RNA polymerase sigma-70 factor, ECF subfamily
MGTTKRNGADNHADDPRYERFVTLFAQVHDGLFAYIFALLPHWSDAQDVFQQTSLVLWRKFGDFRAKTATDPICTQHPEDRSGELDLSHFSPETDFLAWACRIAFYEVRNFRRVASRSRLQFNDALLTQLAEDRSVEPQRFSQRREFLMECVAKLPDEQRALLHRAYEGELTIRQLAEELHRSPQTLYNRLNLIRRTLFECIEAAVKRQKTKQ